VGFGLWQKEKGEKELLYSLSPLIFTVLPV
jgi:hypothetical protein